MLFAGTLWAQGGFLDFRSEERYFIYAVPFLWIGAVAAVERRALPARWIVVAGGALALVLVTVPIAVQAVRRAGVPRAGEPVGRARAAAHRRGTSARRSAWPAC